MRKSGLVYSLQVLISGWDDHLLLPIITQDADGDGLMRMDIHGTTIGPRIGRYWVENYAQPLTETPDRSTMVFGTKFLAMCPYISDVWPKKVLY